MTFILVALGFTITGTSSIPMTLGSVRALARACATSSNAGGTTSTTRLESVMPSGGSLASLDCHVWYPAFSGNGSHFHPSALRVLDISSTNSQGSSPGAVAATKDTEGNSLIAWAMRPFCSWLSFLGSSRSANVFSSTTKSLQVQNVSRQTPKITSAVARLILPDSQIRPPTTIMPPASEPYRKTARLASVVPENIAYKYASKLTPLVWLSGNVWRGQITEWADVAALFK
jgi:hypothetical protein